MNVVILIYIKTDRSSSQSCQIRWSLRFPLHGMELALSPLLHHGSSTLPPSLPTRALFRDSAVVCCFRFRHLYTTPSSPLANCRCSDHHRDMELPTFQSAHLWKSVDKDEVYECAVDEDLGLFLVSPNEPLLIFSY